MRHGAMTMLFTLSELEILRMDSGHQWSQKGSKELCSLKGEAIISMATCACGFIHIRNHAQRQSPHPQMVVYLFFFPLVTL